jgi:hypothetical protein
MSRKRERENDYLGEELELLNFIERFKRVLKNSDPALNMCEFVSGKRITTEDVRLMSHVFKTTSFSLDVNESQNIVISILTNRDDRLKQSILANELEKSKIKKVNHEKFLTQMKIADSPHAEKFCEILTKIYDGFIDVVNIASPTTKDGKVSLTFYMDSLFSNSLFDFCDKNPKLQINIFGEKGVGRLISIEVSYTL